MANYASIIKGTIRAIGSKAKEIAESNAVRDVCDRGAAAAKSIGNIAKLTVLINGEQEEQRKLFIEVGKLFFELNKDQPPELYAELFSKLAALDEKIESMREELNAAKAAIESQTEPGVQVEIVEELPDVLPEAPADGE